MSLSRSKLLLAVVATVVLAAVFYLVATVGLQALRSSSPEAGSDAGSLPQFVYKAPETVPTTADLGAPGPVSVVFAGTDVQTGLFATQRNPWITISGRDGGYRALSAPHRPAPAPGAVRVSPDGTTLAWGFEGGVVVYDAIEGEVRELTGALGAGPRVGKFSPDARHLLVHDGSLQVVDAGSGEVVATLDGVAGAAAREAVWTPDGSAVTYAVDGELVQHDWRSGETSGRPAPVAAGTPLAWLPDGTRLAALREERGVKMVDIFEVSGAGPLTPSRTLAPDGYAIQDLVGPSGENSVAVTALRLETGPLTILYSLSTVDDRQPMELTQLPGPGVNWVDAETAQFASDALASSSTPFDEPRWPWSKLGKLVASMIAAVFIAGVYFTRPTSRRRLRRR